MNFRRPKPHYNSKRTTVPVMRREEIPASWLPSVRLIETLAAIVSPDDIIDIPEVQCEEDDRA